MHMEEVMSVCLHVASPKLMNRFLLNLVITICTKTCEANSILIHNGQIQPLLYIRTQTKLRFSKSGSLHKKICTLIKHRSQQDFKISVGNIIQFGE
jgi:hypothetical protein